MKQAVEEKVSAVRKCEEGAADLKKKFEELSKGLEENEKEYQVRVSLQMFDFFVNSIDILFTLDRGY